MVKSPVRICRTCKGNGVVPQTTVSRSGGRTLKVTTDVACPARCNNGALDIRTV
jgi:hypothetical protein